MHSPVGAYSPLRLGIIGCGNMGGALASGVQNDSGLSSSFPLVVFDSFAPSAQRFAEKGAREASSASELAQLSDIILLAVKPHAIVPVLDEIAPSLGEPGVAGSKLLISIAAGVTLDVLRAKTGSRCPVTRVMSNTLAMVGEGLFGLCFDTLAPVPSSAHKEASRRLFSPLGKVIELAEGKMNGFTALAGGGPAYVFYFLESLAEAGVGVGLTREQSSTIALSLLKGGAMLAEQSGRHPALLREMVCSPGGTTIAAINHLDRTATRGNMVDAIHAACDRGHEMDEER